MWRVCMMNCDTGRVFYMFPLKFLSICMLNVTVTFLSTLQFFLGNWNAFMLYSLQGYSCKLKKKKKTKNISTNGVLSEYLQTIYNLYCRHCIDVTRTVCFHPSVMSEQCRASPIAPAHWNKRPTQRRALGWAQFSRVFMHGHTSL